MKIGSNDEIQKEYYNSIHVKNILKDNKSDILKTFKIINYKLFKINNVKSVLISEYKDNFSNSNLYLKKIFSFLDIVVFLKKFLTLGIKWSGFLPRNILIDQDNNLWLIDFEDVEFFNFSDNYKLDDVTSLKFLIAWVDVYCDWEKCKSIFEKNISFSICKNLDKFEKTYLSILGGNVDALDIKNMSTKNTLNSELYCHDNYGKFSPSQVGHIIDEHLPITWSVFYTVFSSNFRKSFGEKYYSFFIAALSNLLFLSYQNNLLSIDISLNLIIAFECIFENKLNFELFQDLSNKKNLNSYMRLVSKYSNMYIYIKKLKFLNKGKSIKSANIRSFILETLICKIYKMITSVFEINVDINLLFRGSFSHCIITTKSDVDFEISGPSYPNGYIGLEKIIIDFLSILRIAAEGSESRPTEKDLISKSGTMTRDKYEFWELRQPLSFVNHSTWLSKEFDVNSSGSLCVPSEYEKIPHELCAKLLFFEIRSCIVNISKYYGFDYINIFVQLNMLKKHVPTNISNLLFDVLKKSVYFYENDVTEQKKLLQLKKQIDIIKDYFNLYKIKIYTEEKYDKQA